MASGCSTPSVKEFVEIPAPLPDSIISFPCDVVGPGTTVTSLAQGYSENTICAGKFKSIVEGIKSYNEKTKQLEKDIRGNK